MGAHRLLVIATLAVGVLFGQIALPHAVHAQELLRRSEVVFVQVTEPGFLSDGRPILDATFASVIGSPLTVERLAGGDYFVHGLRGRISWCGLGGTNRK